MRSRPVPRIRVELPDGSLSPSSTLDIRGILGQAKLLPKLLAEDFVFDNTDDVLYFDDGHSQDFPSFPMRQQPRPFILNSHRARLPFPIRPDAFEMGDLCRDEEDIVPLLTVPTAPRMKMMMKEPLYVQKWVDALSPNNPPKHIPWTCETPAMKKRWIAEGSIFPADVVKSPIGQCGAIRDRSGISDTNRFSTLVNQESRSRALCALSEASALIHASTRIHTSTPHVRIRPADIDSGISQGEGKSKASHSPHRTVGSLQAPLPSTLLHSSFSVRTTSCTPNAPLAARRGKSLNALKLEACVIDRLEYPDIPTAFRGSPIIWSPRFDDFPAPSFTDHENMVLDLKSKCAALGSGVSAYTQEPLDPHTELNRTSFSTDEWAFTRGLTTFDSTFLESIDGQVPREIIADTSVFLTRDSSTPVEGLNLNARLGVMARLHTMPAAQHPGKRSSDPPGVPLPPRPALINPLTPPHVRGILKKVKSVRFEDMTTVGSEDNASPVVPPLQGSSKRFLSSPAAVSPGRPCTPMPHTAKLSGRSTPAKQALKKNIQKRPGSRLPPKRAKADGRLEPISHSACNGTEPSDPNPVTTPVERPCRIARAKEVTIPRVQGNQKGLSITEVDVRRGIEGNTKSRLSTPLRNIFRFR